MATLLTIDIPRKIEATMVNKAAGATIEHLDAGSEFNTNLSMSGLFDGDPGVSSFAWLNLQPDAHLRVTLSSPTYVGSVIFVTLIASPADEYSHVGEGYLYAGSHPTDVSACKICNDGNLITTHGAVNCLAPDSTYLHFIMVTADSMNRVKLAEIMVYEQPELSQLYLSLEMINSRFLKHDESAIIGTI